ncbi:MAG: hypothetical protein M0C28_44550 [Candidatus Moduliflexus flocculans]|nr:hypothetical protein [Candidatus Moduliflexus flocculans]
MSLEEITLQAGDRSVSVATALGFLCIGFNEGNGFMTGHLASPGPVR